VYTPLSVKYTTLCISDLPYREGCVHIATRPSG
jgi:hypothetical protein